MAQDEAPSPPQREFQISDTKTGLLTQYGISLLDQLWRQVAAGFSSVPCIASTTANLITLTPRLHEEGARTYGDGMIYTFLADANSSGAVTAKVQSGTKVLSTVKVYIDGGATQANAGDVDLGKVYLAVFEGSLDAGNGGLVLK
jgi:hypothetical protein